jgi:Gpi18-like mannosyltransferase
MKKLVIVAIIIRILVAMFLFHPDTKTIGFQTSFFKQGVFNIYTYLASNTASLPLKENFVYFPLAYLTLGSYQAVISPIPGPGFDSWLADADSVSSVTNPDIFGYLLALKIPYLIADILIGFILLNYFTDKKLGEKAFTLWLFNPFTIFIIYAFGNIDTFPIIVVLLSLLFIKKDKAIPGAIAIGLAAGFKIYPLLFVPFLIFSGKNIKEKVLLGIIPLGIFGAVCLPFFSSAFFQSTLISGLTTRMVTPGFSVGFGEAIIVGLMLLSGLFFYIWLKDKKPNMFSYWLAVLLIIFSFSHFHIAWLLWAAPFVVILAVEKPFLAKPLFLISLARSE